MLGNRGRTCSGARRSGPLPPERPSERTSSRSSFSSCSCSRSCRTSRQPTFFHTECELSKPSGPSIRSVHDQALFVRRDVITMQTAAKMRIVHVVRPLSCESGWSCTAHTMAY